jgi:hypothetical protein
MAERENVHAIHAEDQRELLGRLGLLDAYKGNELKCRDCERSVLERGLGLVQMNSEGKIEVACADASCRLVERGA